MATWTAWCSIGKTKTLEASFSNYCWDGFEFSDEKICVSGSRGTLKNSSELYLSSHNAHVINRVPKDRLLIWNLKDGWEPICNFVNVPIPDQPIPVLNKTTDPLFFDRLRSDLRIRWVPIRVDQIYYTSYISIYHIYW